MTNQANSKNQAYLASLVPFTVLPGAVIWAVFWITFDLLFRFLGTEEIWIPRILIILALLGLAFSISKPIAKMTAKALACVPQLGQGIAVLAVLTSEIMGEGLYLVASVWLHQDDIPIQAIIQGIPTLVSRYPGNYIFLKCLFAFCLIFFVKGDVKERIQHADNANQMLHSDG